MYEQLKETLSQRGFTFSPGEDGKFSVSFPDRIILAMEPMVISTAEDLGISCRCTDTGYVFYNGTKKIAFMELKNFKPFSFYKML